MRATVAKRLRRMISATTNSIASESMLVHQVQDRANPRHNTAVLSQSCGRYYYQQAKKQYKADKGAS